MTSLPRVPLFVLLCAITTAACSSGDFAVSTPVDGSAPDDTQSAADTSVGGDAGGEDASASDTTAGDAVAADANVGDIRGDGVVPDAAPDVPLDTRPICNEPAPAIACTAPAGTSGQQFDVYDPGWLTPRMAFNTAYAVSYKLGADGRHDVLRVRLRTIDIDPTGVAGKLTLTAFRMPCPGVFEPLEKVVTLPVIAVPLGEDFIFEFNDANSLMPAYPMGTRLAFVLTSDSTRYHFDLGGKLVPAGTDVVPQELKWYFRAAGAEAFQQGPGFVTARASMSNCSP